MSRVDVTSSGWLQFNEWTAPISQDAWIFKAPLPAGVDGDYFFGWLGCDNRIAHELKSKNFHVINPSLKIICRHVHMTEKRNYTSENKVPGAYVCAFYFVFLYRPANLALIGIVQAAVPPSADF